MEDVYEEDIKFNEKSFNKLCVIQKLLKKESSLKELCISFFYNILLFYSY